MSKKNELKTKAKLQFFKKNKSVPIDNDYDMSTKEKREIRIQKDFDEAITNRQPYESKWRTFYEYYHNQHYSKDQIVELANKHGWDFVPPVLPDPFIQVESQVDIAVPSIQFIGRGGEEDAEKARLRQSTVDFVLYNNQIENKMILNERRLNMLGSTCWRVGWDESKKGLDFEGDIVVEDVDPSYVFPDPSAYTVEDCEYIIYAHRVHQRKARRKYGKVIDKLTTDGDHATTEIYKGTLHFDNSNQETFEDGTMLVIEYYYKDLDGDVAMSTIIDGEEVQFAKKFWENTRHSGNEMLPIIIYHKIPELQSIWGLGEVETIIDLVDTGDRQYMSAVLNEMMMGNDIIVADNGAFEEGTEPENVAGAIWTVKQGKNVRRMGGIANANNSLNLVNFAHEKIEETNGNYASESGKEPMRVTTASGIAQLNEKAQARTYTKQASRLEGFKQLAKLIDWFALEFYDDDRLILIRDNNKEVVESFNFNSNDFSAEPKQNIEDVEKDSSDVNLSEIYAQNEDEEVRNILKGDITRYFPTVDVEISAGNGITKSRAFTLQATQELAGIQATPENVEVLKSIVDLLELPNADIIKDSYDKSVEVINQQRQIEMQGAVNQQQQVSADTTQTQAETMELEDSDITDIIQMLPQAVQEKLAQEGSDVQEQVVIALSQAPDENTMIKIVQDFMGQ